MKRLFLILECHCDLTYKISNFKSKYTVHTVHLHSDMQYIIGPLRFMFCPALTACSMLSGLQNRPSKVTSSRRIRSRWQLLYTLVNNPSLLGSRKHFQTRQSSESILNGTPNHSSKKGSKKESSRPAAEPDQSTENPTNQDKDDWVPYFYVEIVSTVQIKSY